MPYLSTLSLIAGLLLLVLGVGILGVRLWLGAEAPTEP